MSTRQCSPVDPRRVFTLRDAPPREGPVVYWMSRDQRAEDNWALLFSQRLAIERGQPLAVAFALAPSFLGATRRQYAFMLRGLEEVEKSLARLHIPFFLLFGSPERTLPAFLRRVKASALVTDFDPLRLKRQWKESVVPAVTIPCYEVDAHNIVPCRYVSEKQEFAARTLRPKIQRALPEFLLDIPRSKPHPFPWPADTLPVDWQGIARRLRLDHSVAEAPDIRPGRRAALQTMKRFLDSRLARYDAESNDPLANVQSDLSPYLHFGQLSAQRVALQVSAAPSGDGVDAFLEQLIVRRELSDNYCLHNPHYDSLDGAPAWARRTLEEHRRDKRDTVYTLEQFERGETHDPLWNAAQNQMVTTGKMANYLRMYWGKKILEWTPSPEEAYRVAITLNDRYELDGRDPNGYAGIAWCIAGVHDRPWQTRPIFGSIRYMNFKGCQRKFDVQEYIRRYSS